MDWGIKPDGNILARTCAVPSSCIGGSGAGQGLDTYRASAMARHRGGCSGFAVPPPVLTVTHSVSTVQLRNLIQDTEILSGKARIQTQICPYCFYCFFWIISTPRRFGPFSWSVWTKAQIQGPSALFSEESLHSFLSRPSKSKPTFSSMWFKE